MTASNRCAARQVTKAVQGFREELAEVDAEVSQLWSLQEEADQEADQEADEEVQRLEAARCSEQERREQREHELRCERDGEALLERSFLGLAAQVEGLESRLVEGVANVGDITGRLHTQVVYRPPCLSPRMHLHV